MPEPRARTARSLRRTCIGGVTGKAGSQRLKDDILLVLLLEESRNGVPPSLKRYRHLMVPKGLFCFASTPYTVLRTVVGGLVD
jgi:hypothetical protein